MAGKGWFSTPELFIAENYGKAMVRHYGDCGLPNHYVRGMEKWLELMDWVRPRYKEVNKRPFPDICDKNLRRDFLDTKNRRAARENIAKQKAVDTYADLFVAELRPVSMEEALEISLQCLEKPDVTQNVYGLSFFHDLARTQFAGTKLGRTVKQQFRAGQIQYAEKDKYTFDTEYSTLIEIGVQNRKITEAIQDEAIRECIARGYRIIHKKEYTNAPPNIAMAALTKAVVKNGIDPIFRRRWDVYKE